MAAEVRRKQGCLAVAAVPVLAVLAPIVALQRRAAQRRRGGAVRVRVERSHAGAVVCVRCELDIPVARVHEIVTALAAAFGDAAVAAATTIGCAGIAPGEEPVLTALPPRRDAVAERVVLELTMGEAHRRPQLWLALAPAVFLAEIVEPLGARAPSLEDIATVLTGGRASRAVLTAVTAGRISTRITLTLLGARRQVLALLSFGRRSLSGLDGWERLER